MSEIKRQTYLYYAFNFVNRFMVYLPVFVLFLNEKGLSQSKVMILMSAYIIAIMAGEIPTGIVADKFSRKASVFIGCILQGIMMLMMVPVTNFVYLIIIEVIFGIGMTFQSGAMSAMFYDYLKIHKSEELYPGIEGKRWASVFLSQAIASVIGGMLTDININLTVVITGIAYLFSAVILLLFKEQNQERVTVSYRKHIFITWVKIIKNSHTRLMLLVIILTNALFQTTIWLYQPYYGEIGIKVTAYGWAYLMMNAVSALGGMFSSKVKLSLGQTIAIYMFGNSICIFIMGVCDIPVGVVVPSIIFFINGIINPWIQSYWEKNIENEERATASSILSLVSSLVFAIIAIPLGFICDENGVNMAFIVAAGCFTGVSVIICAIYCIGRNKFVTKS